MALAVALLRAIDALGLVQAVELAPVAGDLVVAEQVDREQNTVLLILLDAIGSYSHGSTSGTRQP